MNDIPTQKKMSSIDIEHFWTSDVSNNPISIRTELPVMDNLLLKRLGTSPIKVFNQNLSDIFIQWYQTVQKKAIKDFIKSDDLN